MKKNLLLLCLMTALCSCNSQGKRALIGKTEYQQKLNASYKDASKSPLKKKDLKGKEKSKYKQLLAVKKNVFFNALQVKFSYAITCHKSQGGQWKTIFIEQPYLPDGPSKEYFRWLYTAVTRAQEKLYLIGFKDEYFEDS